MPLLTDICVVVFNDYDDDDDDTFISISYEEKKKQRGVTFLYVRLFRTNAHILHLYKR